MNKEARLFSGATPAQVAKDLAPLVDFQSEGITLEELRSMVATRLIPHLMQYDQPRFQSMFNAFPPPEAKIGAQIALDYNQGVTNWQVSPGGAVLEELCAEAICRLFNLGPRADATFMYSGTYGNQQGLYMALHRYAEERGFDLAKKGVPGFKDPARLAILASKDAHFSLKHAVRTLGLGEDSLVLLPLDSKRRIDSKALEKTVHEIGAARDIFCMVATAGTTNIGAIDPINVMADLSNQIGAWLHVDGAYGYAYKLVPEWSHLFMGDDRADSIVWDPHKQLGAPIPNSVLFVKEKDDFGRMTLHSAYFNRAEEQVPNPGIKSPPSTRPMSALPLVTILRGQGINKVTNDLRSPLIGIRKLAEILNKQPDVELFNHPETGILCFRMIPKRVRPKDLNNLQKRLYEEVMASGIRSISLTNLDGVTFLRVVIVSPNATFDDLYETIEELRKYINLLPIS